MAVCVLGLCVRGSTLMVGCGYQGTRGGCEDHHGICPIG
jgi:hypothetical protein